MSQSNALLELTASYNYQNLKEIIRLKLNVSEQQRYNKLQIKSRIQTYGLKQSSTNNNNNNNNESFNVISKFETLIQE